MHSDTSGDLLEPLLIGGFFLPSSQESELKQRTRTLLVAFHRVIDVLDHWLPDDLLLGHGAQAVNLGDVVRILLVEPLVHPKGHLEVLVEAAQYKLVKQAS